MTDAPSTTPPESSDEKVYFEGNDVRVTSTRAIMRNKTYPMVNVSSVSIGTTPPNASGVGCLALIGLGGLATALVMDDKAIPLVVGVLAIAGAIAWYRSLKPTYVVRIGAAGGEADGFTSKDKELVERIIDAMNEAIIRRG